MILTLLFLFSPVRADCPGIVSIRQDGTQVYRFHISIEGLLYRNDEVVDQLGTCVDHIEVISPEEIIYIVNEKLFFRTVGVSEDELDSHVSTVTYDRVTSIIYWIKEGKVFFLPKDTRVKSLGTLHEAQFNDESEYTQNLFIFISLLTVTVCLSTLAYRKKEPKSEAVSLELVNQE